MSNIKNIIFLLVLLLVLSFYGFSQDFNGTNLSSDKPYYSELPYVFEGSEFYRITFRTDPEIIRKLVPEPLVPISNGEMMVFFVKHHIVSPAKIDYQEAYFLIPVGYDSLYGGFIPVLYLDKIESITPAREIWGYNKVGGNFEFQESGDKVTITVKELDTLIMKASFTLGEPFVPPQQPQGGQLINYKYIPSVEKDAPPEVNQLTASGTEGESKILKVRSGTATLEFFPSYFNPVDKIPILEIKDAGYSLNNFEMHYGKVLYDYLKEE